MIEWVGYVITGGIVAVSVYYILKSNRLVKNAKVTLVDENEKYELKLIQITRVSHDTRKFRFALPSDEHILGLPIGQHIYLSAHIDGKLIVRPYTPVSSDEDKGFVDLMVKVYYKNVNPKFPDGGKMSQHLDSMKIGDTINFRGPNGLIVYKGHGVFKVKADKKSEAKQQVYKKLSMIAGGTGITPMLQVIDAILRNPNDDTKIRFLFANQTEKDILCRNELDTLARNHPERFQVWYTVSTKPDNWEYSHGHIDSDMINMQLFPPSHDSVVLMCGPPPMINFACSPNLDKLEYNTEHRLIF